MNKLLKSMLVFGVAFSVFSFKAEAATSKVWWDGAELKPGQIGRITVQSEISLYKFDRDGKRVDLCQRAEFTGYIRLISRMVQWESAAGCM